MGRQGWMENSDSLRFEYAVPALPPFPALRSFRSLRCCQETLRSWWRGVEHRRDRKERRAGRSRGKCPTLARPTASVQGGTQRFVSGAALGRGIWGMGMEGDESAAAGLARPCHGKILPAREDFAAARMASLARCQPVTSHSFALNCPAKLGRASERLRPAPQTKSRLSSRASSGHTGRRSLAIPTAPFPRHALRPETGRAPLWLRLHRPVYIASLWSIRIGPNN